MDSKPGSFSAYLEYAQRNTATSTPRPTNPTSLLNFLSQSPDRQAPMSSLAEVSGMSAAAFRDALAKLSESGFIKISGDPLSAIVELTDKGQDVASLFS